MTYRLVYDTAADPLIMEWAGPLVLIVPGVLLVFAKTFMQRMLPHPIPLTIQVFLGWCLMAGAAITAAGSYAVASNWHQTVADRLLHGQYDMVEGPVTDFVASMGGKGASQERFVVQGQRFAYWDGENIAGFHHTAATGGPLREGLHVRITYSGATIYRLEVAQ